MAIHESFRIMLVEDSATCAELAKCWLEDGLGTGFILHRAAQLSSALELLQQRVVDLTILDLNLPDSRGLDTFRSILEQDRSVPIVILSSEMDEELALDAVRLGAQDYVVKDNRIRNPLARPVLFAWERVQRYRAEAALRENNQQLQVARSVQRYLLPDGPPMLPGFDIACRCEPANLIGGDYYDFIPLQDGSLGLAIADVSGHGTAAALLMVEVRATLRALAGQGLGLSEVMHITNQLLTPDLDYNFVTAFFGVLQPQARILRYGSAAHPAVLMHADGAVNRRDSHTPPLGVHTGGSVISDEITLRDADVLVLYTDGLVERLNARNGLFGLNRLLEVLIRNRHLTAQEILECILMAVRDFSGGTPQADDETLVIVKVGSEY
ncbi:MAG: SpoIIE family protein phosphatase [Planctomycetaceae bacterium]